MSIKFLKMEKFKWWPKAKSVIARALYNNPQITNSG